MAAELHWGAEAVSPRERSLPGLKAAFLLDHAPATGCVLEIGSGDGKNLRTLAAARPRLKLVGCDVRAPRTAPDVYQFVLLLEGRVPASLRGSFDAVLLFDVLEHVPDPAATLEAAALALKPQGTLIAFVPVEGEPLSAYRLFRALLGDDVYVDTKEHIQAFTHRGLRRLVEEKFVVSDWRYSYHLLGHTMDAGFFAAQRVGKLRDFWRRDNAYYNADKKTEAGAAGAMNTVLRFANRLAWHESTAFSRIQMGSAGVLFAGRPR